MKVNNMHPVVAVLTETWLDGDTPDWALHISNYNITCTDRNRHEEGIICKTIQGPSTCGYGGR